MARASSLLTKPLPLFYAAESAAKAVAIVADSTLDGLSFRAHGLYAVKSRRYKVRTLSCRVAEAGSDVWSRLWSTSNFDLVWLERVVDGGAQITDHVVTHKSTPLQAGHEIELGELMRQVPEIAEDVVDAGIRHPYVVHVSDHSLRLNSNTDTAEMRCTLRHAHIAATKEMLFAHEAARGELRHFRRGQDVLDTVDYHAPARQRLNGPPMRSDVFGRLYMNFVRTRSYFGELSLFHAALFILSDAVRYQGQWQALLAQRPHEEVLVDRFLDVASRKLPNLALNHLTGVVHVFSATAI